MPGKVFHLYKKKMFYSPFPEALPVRMDPNARSHPNMHSFFFLRFVFYPRLALRSEVIMTLLFISQNLLTADISVGKIKTSW